MNLAFPALLIILYILPGVVFANGLLAPSRRLGGSQSLDWSTQIAYGAFLALPIHCVALTIVGHLPTGGVSPNLAGALALLADKNGDVTSIIDSVAANHDRITLYFTVVTILAYPMGSITGILVAVSGITVFSISPWDTRFKSKPDHRLFVSAVVERGSALYLYVGLYTDRLVDEKGTLRGIWLSSARRRPLADDIPENPNAEIFYHIQADIFFLVTDKVQTFSFKYFRLEHTDEIRRIAHSIWDTRIKNNQKIATAEEDWKRAEMVFQYRFKNSRGWRKWISRFHYIQKKRAKTEDQIKTSIIPGAEILSLAKSDVPVPPLKQTVKPKNPKSRRCKDQIAKIFSFRPRQIKPEIAQPTQTVKNSSETASTGNAPITTQKDEPESSDSPPDKKT